MIPVICFYEDDLFIHSENYQLLLCDDSLGVTQFLQDIEKKYPENMKIVQVNFDAYHSYITAAQTELYPSSKAAVFILKDYKLISLPKGPSIESRPFQLQMTKNQFLEKVNAIKAMIAAGRFYQVNLTCAFKSERHTDPLSFFLSKQDDYVGGYKSFLPFKHHSLISFSPELFLEKKSSILRTEPIKGSISKNENADSDLIKNEKEESELSMIVDLLRNDLNSLESKTSAKVTQHRQLMNLSYIQHTFSEIQIETTKTLPFILENMMPGGSISGCPKKESLIAISELEPNKRSAYTGTIGWWKDNDFKLNIAIRTFVQAEQGYFYFAGCGIVYDSNPEKEFTELLNKTGRLNVQYK